MDSGAPVQSALDQFTMDLTAAARAGELDPVFGRDVEIRQVIDVLMRRRQNNPLLVGEPGVGKTAIVEGLAAAIVSCQVPSALQPVSIRSLDLGLLLAGASVRGEFESRLKAVVKEVESSTPAVILFIDEAHMLVGSGGQADAANLLKPALARGNFKTIAATTRAEYRKYFEKDPAFARRFQVITVEEPSEIQAIQMLRPLVPLLERHHGVYLTDDAVSAAVRLSHRYVIGRQLPDKAVSVLDTCCARVLTAQRCTPLPVHHCQRRVAELEEEIRSLEREQITGSDRQEELTSAFDQLAAAEMQLADLEDRWREEKGLVKQLLDVRAQIEIHREKDDTSDMSVRFQEMAARLKSVAGEFPLVPAFVDGRMIAEVISEQTGIPVGRMLQNEIQNILNLRNLLAERIIGQAQAIQTIARRLLNTRAGLEDPKRPVGVFLLVGPSGVGKTETGLALADVPGTSVERDLHIRAYFFNKSGMNFSYRPPGDTNRCVASRWVGPA
jgi:type VI secretion system protein VasG